MEAGTVEAVEAEVHRFQAEPGQLRYVWGRQHAVGGHVQLTETGNYRQPFDKRHQARPHERFPAC